MTGLWLKSGYTAKYRLTPQKLSRDSPSGIFSCLQEALKRFFDSSTKTEKRDFAQFGGQLHEAPQRVNMTTNIKFNTRLNINTSVHWWAWRSCPWCPVSQSTWGCRPHSTFMEPHEVLLVCLGTFHASQGGCSCLGSDATSPWLLGFQGCNRSEWTNRNCHWIWIRQTSIHTTALLSTSLHKTTQLQSKTLCRSNWESFQELCWSQWKDRKGHLTFDTSQHFCYFLLSYTTLH